MKKREWGGAREGSGRRPKPIEERAIQKGRVTIRISAASAALLQLLMLRETPGVGTPEQMVEHLIRQAFDTPGNAPGEEERDNAKLL